MQLTALIKKELRTIFYSPVALLFLLIFLSLNLFSFFYLENFWERGLADLRPFFKQMPLLMVFLCASFTMKFWAEENSAGTGDLLATIPIPGWKLVLGKFLSGLFLIMLALIFTLPLPMGVAALGELDWGPVIGGYLGLIFLGGTYLAMGLAISATTTNQLVALLASTLLGLFFLFIGEIPQYFTITPVFKQICLSLGSGSHFSSLLRGLIDLRDLLYYATMTVFFLAINCFIITCRRWDKNQNCHNIHWQKSASLVLLSANLLAANIAFFPVQAARFDLTSWQEYSVSPVTRQLLNGLEEPLLIRGYFSKKTHPLVEPLVARLTDYLTELSTGGPDNLHIEIIDPAIDPRLEEEAQNDYGLRSFPFRFASDHAETVVNAYFHLLIRYGDNFELLDFSRLVEISENGERPQIRLRNFEYQLARAIKKAAYTTPTLEEICKKLPQAYSLTLFASKANLPAGLTHIAAGVSPMLQEMVDRCHGPLSFAQVDPDDPESGISAQTIYEQYGLRPLATSAYDPKSFFLHLLIESDKGHEIIDLTAFDKPLPLRGEIENILQKDLPGHFRKIALVSSGATERETDYSHPTYQALLSQLAQNYEVTQLAPPRYKVASDIEVLIWPRPEEVSIETAWALDQFLLRGGTLIVGGGSYHFTPELNGGITLTNQEPPLAPLLAHYGIASAASVILDRQNGAFPIPVTRKVGDLALNEIKLLAYPPFLLIDPSGFNQENQATAQLNRVIIPWSSPVGCQKPAAGNNISCEILLTSSPKSWEVENFNPNPDFEKFPESGFPSGERLGRLPLLAAVSGTFSSYFTPERLKKWQLADLPYTQLTTSSRPGKLLVFGSSSFVEDLVLAITKQTQTAYLGNLQLIDNLVSWALEDQDLLTISNHENYTRHLSQLTAAERRQFEIRQFIMALILTLTIFLLARYRRSSQKPAITREKQPHA